MRWPAGFTNSIHALFNPWRGMTFAVTFVPTYAAPGSQNFAHKRDLLGPGRIHQSTIQGS